MPNGAEPSYYTALEFDGRKHSIGKLKEMKLQNLAGKLRGNGTGSHEDLTSFPADAPDNEAPKSLQRPPNKPTDLT